MRKVLLVLVAFLALNSVNSQELRHDVLYENYKEDSFTTTRLEKFEKVDKANDYHYLKYQLSGTNQEDDWDTAYFSVNSKAEIITLIEDLILSKPNKLSSLSVGYSINMTEYISLFDTDLNKFINITVNELSIMLEKLKQQQLKQ